MTVRNSGELYITHTIRIGRQPVKLTRYVEYWYDSDAAEKLNFRCVFGGYTVEFERVGILNERSVGGILYVLNAELSEIFTKKVAAHIIQ